MTLTGIRIYAVSTVVSGEDIRLSAVRVSNYQLTVTEVDGTTGHFVGIIKVAPRCEVGSRPCVTTTPSFRNKTFANIVATMLRGADGQGVKDVYIDESGYIHIILKDGKDVSCELRLPQYYTKEEVGELYATIESLSKKQDKIADLATIRSGAEKGATAVQPSNIARVAKSGSYADLLGKPTFKTVNGESVVGEGNIEIQGGSGGAKVYHLNESWSASGTLSQEAYDGVMSADIVITEGCVVDKVINDDGSAILIVHSSSGNVAITVTILIAPDKTYTYTSEFFVIPTKVSELENDSEYLTNENLADVAVMTEKFGEGKYAFTNGISDGELIYAVPTSANGDEDDVLVTRSTLCTINGDGIFNINGLSNIITHPLQKRMSIAPGQSIVLTPSYNIFVDNTVVGMVIINFPAILSEAKQTRCSISFLTGAASLTINYGATIWWANGDSPSIEANTMYEMTFVWNAVANAWLGVYEKFKA